MKYIVNKSCPSEITRHIIKGILGVCFNDVSRYMRKHLIYLGDILPILELLIGFITLKWNNHASQTVSDIELSNTVG